MALAIFLSFYLHLVTFSNKDFSLSFIVKCANVSVYWLTCLGCYYGGPMFKLPPGLDANIPFILVLIAELLNC